MTPATLRWGVLGTASIARTLVPAIRASGCGLVAAVASRSEQRARAFAEEYGIPHAFGSYAALLRSGTVDVLYNPLPNRLHAEWTIAALEAGLPVLCEKPLACDATEAATIAAASARTGLPVAEAFMYRFHPLWSAVRAVVAAGRLGPLVSVAAQFTFRLDDPTSISASAALAGGALMDVGCYAVNVARLVTGREPVRALALRRGTAVDESLFGLLALEGGVVAQVECGIESHERHRVELAGTDGSIVVDRPWFPGLDEAHFLLRVGEREERMATPGGDGYVLEVADFAEACTSGRAPRWSVEDAVANMRAVDALAEAARCGRAIDV